MPNVNIRRFSPQDREAVRRITFNTAFMGEPGSIFFDGEKILCDALTLYFTDYEPQSCFVAEVNGEVVGCLLGAKNKAFSEKIIGDKIAGKLFGGALMQGIFFKKKNSTFFFNSLISLIKGEFAMPSLAKMYPATLHINIREGYRGLKIGSQLISAYLAYLAQEKIPGLHLATFSDRASVFFAKQGFNLLHKGKRSYFRHILHRDVPLYVYGKRIFF